MNPFQKLVMDIHGLMGRNAILDKEMARNKEKMDRITAEIATNNAEIERLKKMEKVRHNPAGMEAVCVLEIHEEALLFTIMYCFMNCFLGVLFLF